MAAIEMQTVWLWSKAQNLNMPSLTDAGANLTIKLAIPDKASAKRGQADWDAPIRAAGGGAS